FCRFHVTAPGPRYFAHSTVMPSGLATPPSPRRRGSPSSVAETFSVAVAAPATDCVAGVAVTVGGVFELMFWLLPPRVVRRRSICQTAVSIPATLSVLPGTAPDH